MRGNNEIRCAVKGCNSTVLINDAPVYTETGLCPTHCVCPECSAAVDLNKHGNPTCPECNSSWNLPSFLNMVKEAAKEKPKSIASMLSGSEFDWMTGQIVFDEGRGPDGVRFLDFFVTSRKCGRDATGKNLMLEKPCDPPCTSWIAQDNDFIYVPELTDDKKAVIKRYPRDVRRLVRGFITMPVIEMFIDTTDPEFKKRKENVMDGSVYGKEFKIS